jgi:hypothetical protein
VGIAMSSLFGSYLGVTFVSLVVTGKLLSLIFPTDIESRSYVDWKTKYFRFSLGNADFILGSGVNILFLFSSIVLGGRKLSDYIIAETALDIDRWYALLFFSSMSSASLVVVLFFLFRIFRPESFVAPSDRNLMLVRLKEIAAERREPELEHG